VAAQRDDSRPVFAAYGDSFVAGWGVSPEDSLPVRLEEEFVRAGKNWRVLNFGVSGETALQGLARLPEVLAAHPRAALVDFGGNDCWLGRPLEETRDAMRRLISGLQGAGCGVFLCGWRTSIDLFDPVAAPPGFTPEYVAAFNTLHGELAAEFGLRWIKHILDPLEGVPDCFQPDGTHPNPKGARLLARALAPLILPLLG
jgi:acyl-CoA thioesterase-1